MTDLTCPKCHQKLPVEDLLGAASGYAFATDSGASSCAVCGEFIEFRLGNGVIEFGYSYWAGSMHFEAVSTHRISALTVVWKNGVLTATVRARKFVFAPAPGGKS